MDFSIKRFEPLHLLLQLYDILLHPNPDANLSDLAIQLVIRGYPLTAIDVSFQQKGVLLNQINFQGDPEALSKAIDYKASVDNL